MLSISNLHYITYSSDFAFRCRKYRFSSGAVVSKIITTKPVREHDISTTRVQVLDICACEYMRCKYTTKPMLPVSARTRKMSVSSRKWNLETYPEFVLVKRGETTSPFCLKSRLCLTTI